jgi:hypothetical protein
LRGAAVTALVSDIGCDLAYNLFAKGSSGGGAPDGEVGTESRQTPKERPMISFMISVVPP